MRRRSIVEAFGLLIIILSISVQLTVFEKEEYKKLYEKYEVYSNSIYVKEELDSKKAELITDEILDYLNDKKDKLEGHNFSKEEVVHMKDVKNIFLIMRRMAQIFGVIILIEIILGRLKYIKSLLGNYVIALVSFSVFLFISIYNFDRAFIIFHKLLFRNDYWMLNPYDSIIINMFPQEIFMYFFIKISFLFLLFSAVFIAIWGYLRKFDKSYE